MSTEQDDDGRTPAGEGEVPVVDYAAVRRAPRYKAFVLTGLVLGALVGMVTVLLGPAPRAVSTELLLLFLGGAGGLLGVGVGAVVALVLDRRSATRFDRDRR